jgi:hypothetical protein
MSRDINKELAPTGTNMKEMIERLGDVLYWTGNALSVVFIILGIWELLSPGDLLSPCYCQLRSWGLLLLPNQLFSDYTDLFRSLVRLTWLLCIVFSLLSWLTGKALRYIVSGK